MRAYRTTNELLISGGMHHVCVPSIHGFVLIFTIVFVVVWCVLIFYCEIIRHIRAVGMREGRIMKTRETTGLK
jgi:hypothetical protein